MLEIVLDRVSELPVVRLTGSLVLGTPAESFRAAVHQLVAEGRANVICHVAGITTFDSTGLAALIAARDTLHRAGGRLVLVQPSMRLQTLLKTTRLISMFQIAEDEAAAVHALGSNWPQGQP